jgi:hypothetical protein
MARAVFLFIGCCVALASCTQRSICPAFQSAYIHDKDVLRKKFSYFLEDSTPKMLTASKNKFLVAEPTPYRKKVRSLQTVEMKAVPVHVPDSMVNGDSVNLADLDRAARSVIDNTFIEDVPARAPAPVQDSVYVITKDRELRLLKYNGADSLEYDPVAEKYVAQKPEYYVKDVGLNIEQDNYMWYLRDYLVLPDVRLAQKQQAGEATESKGKRGKKEKQGLKGFFKNLFKKKRKDTDSIQVVPPPQEEFDFIDADTLTQAKPVIPEQETKKGFLASRQKKPTVPKADSGDPAILPADSDKPKSGDPLKEEDEDGGF